MKRAALSEFKVAEYNPSSRIEEKNLTTLKKSMEEFGLIYPIAVTEDMVVLDGHRRIAVAKELGWETLPYITVKTDNPDGIYASLGSTSRRISGADNLQIWLKNPNAVTPRTRSKLETVKEKFGIKLIQSAAKRKLSPTIFNYAVQIGRYVGDESDEFARKVLRWLIRYKMQAFSRAYMSMLQPPNKLYNHIIKNTPIEMKAT